MTAKEELMLVDATPDAAYPRRILEAHLRLNTSSTLTDNLAGIPPTSPLAIEMNRLAVERAELLRDAIAVLARRETIGRWRK